MRTLLADHTGTRPLVDVLPDSRLGDPTLLGGEQRFTTIIVRHVWPSIFEIVFEDIARTSGNADRSISLASILERRLGVWPVRELQVWMLLFASVVVDVESVSATHPHTRLDQNEQGNVLDSSVFVCFKITKNLVRPACRESGLADVPTIGDDWRLDLLEQAVLNRVDSPAPFDEDSKRIHLRLLASDVEVFAPPDAELVDVTSREVVEVLDALLVAPVDEEPEPGPVGSDGGLLTLPSLVVQVEF